ncbi:hypothetical protein V6N13_064140 [Hibiscus sabdariffa]
MPMMKAELEKMQEERKCMEAWLISAESALKEKKRMLSEYKAMAKLALDLQVEISPADGGYDSSSGGDHSGEAGATDGGHSQ